MTTQVLLLHCIVSVSYLKQHMEIYALYASVILRCILNSPTQLYPTPT